ncbi:MAG: hypothetical protein IKQ72_07075 [Bacteroidaceae bacterium]|nr:hypothetical protein [Bacteroidaceae bacterium]
MAKIFPIDTIKGMSGKVCSHSNTYFNFNHSSCTCHTGKICNPYTGAPTARQLAQQEAFKQKMTLVSAWLNANHPTDANPLGTDAYREAQRLKKSLRLSNIRQVICRYIDAEGKVTLPSGSTSVTPASGGNEGGNTGGNTGGNEGGGGGF